MRKILAIGVAGIALLLILVLAGFGIMHTRYFTPSAQWIVQQLWPETLRFAKIEYLYPFKLRLSGVQIASEPTIELQQMDLWLNPYGLLEQQLEIDSVLIDGANLAHGLPNFTLPESVHLNQLALHNIDWADQGIIARGVSLQIKQPVWDSPQQQLPYGKFSSRPTKSLSMVKHLIKCWLMPITKPKTVPCTGFRSTGAIAPFQDKRNSIHKAGR